jgi:hypothetical protein
VRIRYYYLNQGGGSAIGASVDHPDQPNQEGAARALANPGHFRKFSVARAREYNLDAPVLGAAVSGVVGGNRVGVAKALS